MLSYAVSFLSKAQSFHTESCIPQNQQVLNEIRCIFHAQLLRSNARHFLKGRSPRGQHQWRCLHGHRASRRRPDRPASGALIAAHPLTRVCTRQPSVSVLIDSYRCYARSEPYPRLAAPLGNSSGPAELGTAFQVDVFRVGRPEWLLPGLSPNPCVCASRPRITNINPRGIFRIRVFEFVSTRALLRRWPANPRSTLANRLLLLHPRDHQPLVLLSFSDHSLSVHRYCCSF
ncbi:hypothetical protein K439DRAFT_461677 [Ramaria rubella]|nr:hypothetical protein K439DRAFT_461677 [Ramaria rubella]